LNGSFGTQKKSKRKNTEQQLEKIKTILLQEDKQKILGDLDLLTA